MAARGVYCGDLGSVRGRWEGGVEGSAGSSSEGDAGRF